VPRLHETLSEPVEDEETSYDTGSSKDSTAVTTILFVLSSILSHALSVGGRYSSSNGFLNLTT